MDFKKTVKTALSKGIISKEELAKLFEVSQVTVERWARGLECPSDITQQLVTTIIEERKNTDH